MDVVVSFMAIYFGIGFLCSCVNHLIIVDKYDWREISRETGRQQHKDAWGLIILWFPLVLRGIYRGAANKWNGS